MASTPAAGFPTGGWGPPKAYKGSCMTVIGAENFDEAMVKMLSLVPLAKKAALTEVGLFIASEVKIRTPVQYGVLRASIGNPTPEDVKAGGNPSDAESNSIFEQLDNTVEVGTTIAYAPFIEHGFTMTPGRVVNIPNVGFRFVAPFSYRGAHMFEQALVVAEKAAPVIIQHWVDQAAKALQ